VNPEDGGQPGRLVHPGREGVEGVETRAVRGRDLLTHDAPQLELGDQRVVVVGEATCRSRRLDPPELAGRIRGARHDHGSTARHGLERVHAPRSAHEGLDPGPVDGNVDEMLGSVRLENGQHPAPVLGEARRPHTPVERLGEDARRAIGSPDGEVGHGVAADLRTKRGQPRQRRPVGAPPGRFVGPVADPHDLERGPDLARPIDGVARGVHDPHVRVVVGVRLRRPVAHEREARSIG
jgi:hypothetical protein